MKSEMRTLVLRFACVVGLVAMASSVMAKEGDDANNNVGIEGTWLSRVTIPNPPPGVPPVFLSLATYTRSGQAIEANSTPQDRSVGLGEWARTGHRTFERTFTYFVFGPDHVFASFTQVTSMIVVAADGETYTATNEFRIYSPSGVLLSSGQNTSVANRCGLGDTVPSCIPS
jgi:hypothetical protein